MGKVVVPKTAQKPPSPRRDAPEVPVGKVAVPKIGQKSPFVTRGLLWSTCGQGRRAKDRSEVPLRHDGMPLMCFCYWSPRRRKVGDRRRDRAVGHIFKSKCYLFLWTFQMIRKEVGL